MKEMGTRVEGNGNGDAERRLALSTAVELIAPDLLRGKRPPAEGQGLLAAAVVGAVMAGDRELLGVMPVVLERLLDYLPSELDWASAYRGGLEVLSLLSSLAETMLGLEPGFDTRL
jgi:hypothetical protein